MTIAVGSNLSTNVSLDSELFNVYTYKPTGNIKGILCIFHGTDRNPDVYRDYAIYAADRYGLVVVAPEFDLVRFDTDAYNRGDVFPSTSPTTWTTRFVPPLIEWAQGHEGNTLPVYVWGFSAGGQFLSRVAAFEPLPAQVQRIGIGGASTHVLPLLGSYPPGEEAPYGLGGVYSNPDDEAALTRYLETALTIQIGGADDDPSDPDLTHGDAPDRQGTDRRDRGENTYDLGAEEAGIRGDAFAWRFRVAPRLDHSPSRMLSSASWPETVGLPYPLVVKAAGSTFDVSTNVLTAAASAADSVSATVTAGSTTYDAAVNETASGVDAISTQGALVSTVSETASGAETAAAAAVFASSVSEAASGVDSISARATFAGSVSEAASGAETVAGAAVFASSVSEAASGVETIEAVKAFVAEVNEAASAAETLAGSQPLAGSNSEAASAADSVSAQVVFASAASETASGAESLTTAATLIAQVPNTASGVETVAAGRVVSSAISETASALEFVSARAVFAGSVSGAASMAEAATTTAALLAAVQESVAGVEALIGGIVYPSTVAEAAALSDVAAARFFWEPETTTQTPGWSGVTTTQTPAWSEAGTTQDPGWTLVETDE